ncbi:hypothetical protein F5B18DRAFT_274672 [Nemania serpens]|nr:hypothetical protein F5B18DRAFT_274672 [Nemania serpens]
MAERGVAKKWTEEEKITFLVRAVQDMQASGAKLSFAKIAEKMPGRTPKALTHLWEKFSKDYADGGNAAASTSSAAAATGTAGDGDPATPVNKRGKAAPGSRKRTAKETAATGEDGAADEVLTTPSAKRPRKPAAPKGKGKAAASAAQAVDEDQDEEEEKRANPEEEDSEA